MSKVLDYSDYVEMTCEEGESGNGVYSSRPSAHDVARAAWRFLDPAERPTNPFAVPYSHQRVVLSRWQEYLQSRHELFGDWWHLQSCPQCHNGLSLINHPTDGTSFAAVTLRLCLNCGWWDTEEELPLAEYDDGRQIARAIHRRAVLREFAVAGSELSVEALRRHLRSHPKALNEISPTNLERLVASVFREHMNCEAIHVGGPGDGGVDVVLVDGERRYAVQVKRRSRADAVEPVSGIREFVGAMVLNGQVRGVYVTTASRYSDRAVRTASIGLQRGVVEYLDLVDGRRLAEICNLTATNVQPAWLRAFTDPSEVLPHVNDGFSVFMEEAMGHPNWRIIRDA